MKPIMFAFTTIMAFAVALPSEVLAQTESETAEAEILMRELDRCKSIVDDAGRRECRNEAYASFAEAEADKAEAAADRAEAAETASDVEAALDEANLATKNAYEAFALGRLGITKERLGVAYDRAAAARKRIRDIKNEAGRAGIEATARAVGERVTEDYRVIYGIYENADLALALADRALEVAESEEDYAEAWKRQRDAKQYRDSVNTIALRAERLTNASVNSVNVAINYLRQAEGESDGSNVHNLVELAKMSSSAAAENAVEVKNLRAQLEE